MAVQQCVLWQGSYVSTYLDEVDTFLGESALNDLGGIPRLDLSLLDLESEEITSVLSDDTLWLEEERSLYIDRLEAWKAPQLNALFEQLQGLETRFTVALIQRSGKPVKAVLTALTEEPRTRFIPYDLDELAQWAQQWLAQRGVNLAPNAAVRLAEYAGETLDVVVDVVRAVQGQGGDALIEWADLVPHLGEHGTVPIYELTKAVSEGDREGALNVLDRLLVGGFHPLAILSMLTTRYRQYLQGASSRLSPEELAASFSTSPGAARYIVQEARKLGAERATRCFILIGEAERNMKGGSTLDSPTTIQLLVLRLAQHFHLARGRVA